MTADYWQGFAHGMALIGLVAAVAVAIIEAALRNLADGLATIAAILREAK